MHAVFVVSLDGCPGQRQAEFVVLFDNLIEINTHHLAFLHDYAAIDDRIVRLLRGAEDGCGDGVMKRPGKINVLDETGRDSCISQDLQEAGVPS